MAFMLAREFSRLGHSVEVVTDVPRGDANDPPFAVTRTATFVGRYKAFRRADVVLFMNLSLHGLVPLLMSGRPLVVSHQGCYAATGFRNTVLESLKRFLTRFITSIACSRYVASQLGSMATIPNALDEGFDSVSPGPLQGDFAFCGRLVSDKGAELCLRAFRRVQQKVPDATLTIIGEGPERTVLQMTARDMGVAEQVVFVGVLSGPGLVRTLSQHACLVVPSLWQEPFGIVALEGLAACGLVIVTNRGGLPEAVGPCGRVVPPEEHELSLAMLDVALARRSGASPAWAPPEKVTRAHLSRHSSSQIASEYLTVLTNRVHK